MNRQSIVSVLSLLGPIAAAAAQVQVPVNPRATYLGISNDSGALPAPAIPLSALGLAPGAWVHVETVGAFGMNGGPDTSRNLIGVFSSNATLLTPTPGLVVRVPGAVPVVHGAPFATANTYNQNRPTDIPEDFVVARTGWSNGALVRVPAGATHVFLSVFATSSNYFTNHTDPNNDYAAVFTPMAPSPFQGTAEHCELRTAVNATPSATPEVKPAAAFTNLSVEVAQRFGVSTGNLFVLGATVYPTTGAPPAELLPGFLLGNAHAVVQLGVMTSSPGLWSLFVPPGYGGSTLLLQGFFAGGPTRNGLFSSSNAHRIELQ